MGQRKTRTAALIATQPVCTYCDVAPSINRDHCPPTAIFDLAHRPPGLEFGACAECHEGTREMDAVIAFISRNFPAPATHQARQESAKHAKNFVARYPHLATMLTFESTPTLYQGKSAHRAFVSKDSQLARTIGAFAARVGMALYRNHTGYPVPKGSFIHASWHPNAELDDDNTINDLLQAMGVPSTLYQGKWAVSDQFRYWSGAPVDRLDLFCCFAAFRESFGTLTIIDPTAEDWRDEDWDPTYRPHRPGFLKGFKA